MPATRKFDQTEISKFADQFKGWAGEFGGKPEATYMWRQAIGGDALEKGAPYFGVIDPNEGPSGPYQGLSLVVFPAVSGTWLISLVVGTSGYGDDFELAARPGTQRTFRQLVSQKTGFCKSSFTDIETKLPPERASELAHLKLTLDKYGQYILAYDVLPEPGSPDYCATVQGHLAAYADLRTWPHNANQRRAVKNAAGKIRIRRADETAPENADEEQVLRLLQTRKYVVLQGAPGTGKTRMARAIGKQLIGASGQIIFTQFHAEMSYSDFVWHIRPRLRQGEVGYEAHHGPLYQAVKAAEDSAEPVVLIIDEINRANLATVLGPVFYLFEYQMEALPDVEVEVGPDLRISRLPANLYVIATMNTADRSLAIVDFALRRRFAWYTLKPREIEPGEGRQFFAEDFAEFARIFQTFASSEELNLQPGQGYFIAADENEMAKRRRFELLPLMREYFAEGLLPRAREDVVAYFRSNQTGEELFP